MVKILSENNLIKIDIIPVYVSFNSSKSLSISEFRKRRKLKKTVNILENIYSFLCDRTIMDFRESRKLVLPAYKSEVQYEVLKHWVNQLVYCFTELKIKHPEENLHRLNIFQAESWGCYVRRMIPIAKNGDLEGAQNLFETMEIEFVDMVITRMRGNKNS